LQPIIYDVAVSADGFISGPYDDVSTFPHQGPVVDDYQIRLASYNSCIMGRKTYEIAFAFGLKLGENPYPAMTTLVFSTSISTPQQSDIEVISKDGFERIRRLQRSSKGPVYLCGGGDFAGQLLAENMISLLRVKRAPIFLGSGTRLFGSNCSAIKAKLLSTRSYEGGIVFQEFSLADMTGRN